MPLIRFGLLAIGLVVLLPVDVSFAQTSTNLTNNTTPLVDVFTPAVSTNTVVYKRQDGATNIRDIIAVNLNNLATTNLTNNTTPFVDVFTPAISGNTIVYKRQDGGTNIRDIIAVSLEGPGARPRPPHPEPHH